jgi:hypothetical protein
MIKNKKQENFTVIKLFLYYVKYFLTFIFRLWYIEPKLETTITGRRAVRPESILYDACKDHDLMEADRLK